HLFYLNVSNTLHGIDLLEITEAIAYVISVVQPSDLLKYLQMFCLPIAQKLHEFTNKYANGASSINDKDIRDACGKYLYFVCIYMYAHACNARISLIEH